MDTEVFKSYLISLGFAVDDTAYRKFNEIMSKATATVEKHTGVMSNSYVKAGIAVTGAIGTIVSSIGLLLESLAKADMGYQLYAMRMHMAKDAAKEFKIVTDAMGQSLENIAWNKELQGYYRELRKDASQMALPKSYEEQMQMIRGIGNEFTRLKVEATYGLQWIGHSLITNLMEPIMGARSGFKNFNDYLRDNMPRITKNIVDAFTPFLKIIIDNIKALKDVGIAIVDFWNSLSHPEKIAAFGGALAVLFFAGGPVGMAIAGFIALGAAISDFYGYLEGKETVIPAEIFESLIWAAQRMAQGFRTAYFFIKLIANTLAAIAAAAAIPGAGVFASEKEAAEVRRKKKEVFSELDKDNNELLEKFSKNEDDRLTKENQARQERITRNAGQIERNAAARAWKKESDADIAAAHAAFPNVPEALIRSVIHAESSGWPTEVSRVDEKNIKNFPGKKIGDPIAYGLMQLRPDTFTGMNYPIADILKFKPNVMAGTQYLDQMLKKYSGDVDLSAAAYNAGPGAVDKAGGIPNYAGTKDYVNKVRGGYLEAGGKTTIINNHIVITGFAKKDSEKIANETKMAIQSAGVGAGVNW